jgi:pimeloyl-ACP methyl ester carboxylesterase
MIADYLLHRFLKMPYRLHATIRTPNRRRAPTLLFLHGIGSNGDAWREVIDKLPSDYRIVSIDLLGFGRSPKPTWAQYDVKRQARAVMLTYLHLRIKGRVVVVGHSLGALVAVELAKRYPLIIASLILCSPPFYNMDERISRIPDADTLLRELYRVIGRHPTQFVKASGLAVRLGLINRAFSLTDENASTYMNALEASIINQTSLADARAIKQPVKIIYGRLDPVIVTKNLRLLAKENSNVTLIPILASHDIMGPFIGVVAKTIQDMVNGNKK